MFILVKPRIINQCRIIHQAKSVGAPIINKARTQKSPEQRERERLSNSPGGKLGVEPNGDRLSHSGSNNRFESEQVEEFYSIVRLYSN